MNNKTEKNDRSTSDKKLLRLLCNHLIGIVVRYRKKTKKGKLIHVDNYVCLTAFILEINSAWYLVTAGHNFTIFWKHGFKPNGRIKIYNASLVDYFGVNPTRHISFNIDIFECAQKFKYIQSQDVDYWFLRLNHQQIKLLKDNGIMPLRYDPSKEDFRGFGGYSVIGFPKENVKYVNKSLSLWVRPVHIGLKYLYLPKHPERNLAFIGDILDMGQQKSILGMSGGPIFGYSLNSNGDLTYEALAIQSQWNAENKSILGCPITTAVKDILSEIKSQSNNQED